MEERQVPVAIEPLHIDLDGLGRYWLLGSVGDLAALLIGDQWPKGDKTRPSFHQALVKSILALDLYVDAATAREAFVEAAQLAGMHILFDISTRDSVDAANALTAPDLRLAPPDAPT